MDSLTAATDIEGLDKVLPLLEEARHEEALPLIEDNLAKQPDVVIWKYLKALVIACQARGPEAVSLLEECSRLDGFEEGFGLPDDVNTLARASALNHLQFETTVDPTLTEPWENLARVAEILNSPDFIDRSVLGRWKANPEDYDVYKKFEAHFQEKDLDETIGLIEEVLEEAPDGCLPRAVLGAKMQEKGKTALAIRHLKKAHDSDPKAWIPHLYLGRVFVGQGRFEDAESRITEAISLRGKASAELYAELATCQKGTYRYDEAMETLFKALDEYPDSFTDWDELTELAGATGETNRLKKALDKACENAPNNENLLLRAVEVCIENGDPLAAEAKLQKRGVFASPGQSVKQTLAAANVLKQLNKNEQAVKFLEDAVKANPKSFLLRLKYGYALMDAGRCQEAENVLKETAMNNPNEREVQVAWGRSLLSVDEAERAHRAFSLAARLAPENAEVIACQGLALLQMGKEEEALPLLKETIKKTDQPLISTLVGLGGAYEKKGLADVGRDFYRQALSADPSHSLAARGWLRTCEDGPDTLKEECRSLIDSQRSDFQKAQLYLNFLHSAYREGLTEVAQSFHQDLYQFTKRGIERPAYLEFLESNKLSRLPLVASQLEGEGEVEKAREVWRYVVTSTNAELSQKATAELLRLDKAEAEMVASSEPLPAADPATAAAPGDPLLSLLDSTLPAGETQASQEVPLFDTSLQTETPEPEEIALFAPPEEQSLDTSAIDASLFQQSSEPHAEATSTETESLFAEPSAAEASLEVQPTTTDAEPGVLVPEPVADSGDPAPAVTEPPAEESQVPTAQAEPVSAKAATEDDDVLAALAGSLLELPPSEQTEEPVAEPSIEIPLPEAETSQEPPLATAPPSSAQEAVATESLQEPLVEQQQEPSPEPQVDSAPEEASSDEIVAGEENLEPTAESVDAAAQGEAAVSEPTPSEDPAPPTPVAEPESPRKELLPIPMAVDFDPQTRRQLHFHEALTQSPSGLFNAETIAHLMVSSALAHEPPDPATQSGTAQDNETLLRALIQSAQSLAQQQQYRASSRLLKTALLYAPGSEPVLNVLQKVELAWAEWLKSCHEFAHAVSLLREGLRRQPTAAALAAKLEGVYQEWMTWSDEQGDHAARDLLSVYLQQEQNAMQQFRSSWEENQAKRAAAAAAAAAVPSAPPVRPQMPPEAAPSTVTSTPTVAAQPIAADPVPTAPHAAPSPPVTESLTQPAPAVDPEPVEESPVEAEAPVAEVSPETAQPTASAAPAEAPVAVESAPTPEPVVPQAQTTASELESSDAPEPQATTSEPAAAAPEPVTASPAPEPAPEPAPAAVPEPAPAAESPAATTAAPVASYSSAEEAQEALFAAPQDPAVEAACFQFFLDSDSMRSLTTALREKSSAEPDEAVWLLLLARAFRKSGSETMAVIQYQKYIKAAPSPESYEELAQTYEEIGKDDFAAMTRKKAERAFG